MTTFPLQLILFGQVEDFYLDLSVAKSLFLDCILVAEPTLAANALMNVVNESRLAQTSPSLLCLYLADKGGVHAWNTFSSCWNALKEQDSFPFLLLLISPDAYPFHQDLLPDNQTLWVLTTSDFEKNPQKLKGCAAAYLNKLSLINPEELFLPGLFEQTRPFLIQSEKQVKSPHAHSVSLHNVLEGSETVPCFNIKSPSMIEPILLAAQRANSAVILEVSPSEILRYFPSNEKGILTFAAIREKLFSRLHLFRSLVDEAIARLELDIPVFVHLDHATSPEIVLYCMDIGYDMVMYDGSMRSFNSNLRTTTLLAKEAHQRGILIEAEFSSVDRKIARSSSKERVIEFFNHTQVDLLGISIGQKHGSDYCFEQLLIHQLKLSDSAHLLTKGKGRLQLKVIEEMLCEKLDEIERHYLEDLRLEIMHQGVLEYNDHFPFHFRFPLTSIALKLLSRFYSKEKKVSMELFHLYSSLHDISFDPAHKDIKRGIDWVGLEEIRQEMMQHISFPAGLVIHGGSSVDLRDFPRLRDMKVVKINFGSSVFRNFLPFLVEKARPFLTHLPSDPYHLTESTIQLLLDFDWQTYKQISHNTEKTFASFIHYLRKFYFSPLQEGSSFMKKEPSLVDKGAETRLIEKQFQKSGSRADAIDDGSRVDTEKVSSL